MSARLGAPERALALITRGVQADPSSLAARTMRLALLDHWRCCLLRC
jgi:hypothetical protein